MTQTATDTFTVEWSEKVFTYTNCCPYCCATAGRACTTRKGRPTDMHNGRSVGPVEGQ